jgi:hypothetical protein
MKAFHLCDSRDNDISVIACRLNGYLWLETTGEAIRQARSLKRQPYMMK